MHETSLCDDLSYLTSTQAQNKNKPFSVTDLCEFNSPSGGWARFPNRLVCWFSMMDSHVIRGDYLYDETRCLTGISKLMLISRLAMVISWFIIDRVWLAAGYSFNNQSLFYLFDMRLALWACLLYRLSVVTHCGSINNQAIKIQ